MSIRFYRNLAIVIFAIGLIMLILYLFDIITVIQMIIINMSIAITEAILLTIVIRNVFKDKIINNILSAKVLVPKGEIFDRDIIANTNIFEKPLIPTNPRKEGIFRVNLEFSEKFEKPLSFCIVRACDTDICEQKIDATCCHEDGIHSLNINTHPKEKLNFRFDKDVKVKMLSVEEFYIP